MEKGQPVWLRSTASRWGWVPAIVHDRSEVTLRGCKVLQVTLRDDPSSAGMGRRDSDESGGRNAGCLSPFYDSDLHRSHEISGGDGYYADVEPFEVILTIDVESAERDELEDVKIRDPHGRSSAAVDGGGGGGASSSSHAVGGTDDLIGLTHLHEPAILHALRVRYDADVIYTSTGPILIAINPFKAMPLYDEGVMTRYRLQGERGFVDSAKEEDDGKKGEGKGKKKKAKKKVGSEFEGRRLPPHAYLTADDAYRAMMRGMEMGLAGGGGGGGGTGRTSKMDRKKSIMDKKVGRGLGSLSVPPDDLDATPTDQSILVSGESGAGKTVTTKIVLNYFAMLSKVAAGGGGSSNSDEAKQDDDVRIEQQVLDSNPILEAFGNARTVRNDNSSRFGKYIDIRFSKRGKLVGASVDTYLLEKVRLIRQNEGERNFHVFYQFLEAASEDERDEFFVGDMGLSDFALTNQSGTYDRRDGVGDTDMHREMMDAMKTFRAELERVETTTTARAAKAKVSKKSKEKGNGEGGD
ncbi:hypothetical protein ACHAWF_006065 [Thalassiosira exigua]